MDVEPIAVIGLACRVPGASDAPTFWRNLVGGAVARTALDRDRLHAAGVAADDLADPAFVAADYLLDDVENFDAGLFGLTDREAALADPQHRLFLELCHAALENAGCDPARAGADIGVYGGRGMETYRWKHVYANSAIVADHMTVGIGNHADAFTTLVSYRLNLTGPSVGVYTACSTSLVAVHVAAEAIRSGECDLALAGGVTVELPAGRGYLHRDGGVESADGWCRPFDAAATGTNWGSGGGVVLLKRLSDALADGDPVRAVILGNAINNDGAGKVGFTAPSVEGQAAAIAGALAVAGVDPRTISYVEAHGTGTALGDPIEVTALTTAYGRENDERQWCAIGSVKSNIGHLSQGAGVVGLIKTVLALEHRVLPPSLGYTAPNPAIDFAAGPFYVNATLATWESDGPRRAGVSSFGIGGTNAHVIVEEAPAPAAAAADRPAHLLQISARSAGALDRAVVRLADHLTGTADTGLGETAYTLRAGRVAYPHRAAFVVTDRAGAVAALRQPKRRLAGAVAAAAPPVAFLFSGQGAQYAGMGAQLYAHEPVYAAAVDECLAHADPGLRDLLCTAPADVALTDTEQAQPALFIVGYALARLWESWGVRPATLLGHSIGEYVAATLAGVFDLPDAVRLVSLRGRLMGSLPAGAMLAVNAAPEKFDLPDGLSVAAVNGPGTCVVSGPTDLVDAFAQTLADRRITAKRLRTSHAFHSAMMDPILDEFAAAVAAVGPRAPRLPLLANLTGTPMTAEQATDPGYWAAHLRGTVRFAAAVAAVVAADPVTVFVECGPGRQLAGLARMQVRNGGTAPVHSLPSPGEPAGDLATLYAAAGRLWTLGVALDPAACGGATRRVPLPGYPYERARHWIEPDAAPAPAARPVAARPAARPVDEWFTVPGWRRLPPVLSVGRIPAAVVFAADPTGEALAERLRGEGTQVVTVTPGDRYERTGPDTFTVRPDRPDEYVALVRDVGRGPRRWIHAWSLAGGPAAGDIAATWRAAGYGLDSLRELVRAVAAAGGGQVDVVSAGTQRVLDADLTRPEHALLCGVTRTARHDTPNMRVRHIDLDSAAPDVAALVRDLGDDPGTVPDLVAVRGGQRWVPQAEQVRVPVPTRSDAGLRIGGTYLITGGLGRLGLHIAEFLAQRVRARLVLVGRAPVAAAERPGVLGAIRRCTAAGGVVEAVAADVTDPAALHAVRAVIEDRFGKLDGIIHAAGVTDDLVLAPKVAGTLALREVFGDLELDFVALFSSVTGAVGGAGEADYCAAHAYLDAYAQSTHGWAAPVRSLAWAGWRESDATGGDEFPTWLSPADGVAAFHRAIATDLGPYVLISPLPVDEHATTVAVAAEPDRGPAAAPAAPAPAPADTGVDALTGIWAAVLGGDTIGADDDFFDLGGTSLAAVQLIAQVRQTFGVRLPMRSVFETPTVATMAARIAQLRNRT